MKRRRVGARKTAALAMSSGSPMRSSGMPRRKRSFSVAGSSRGSASIRSMAFVMTWAGWMALTRIRCGAHSTASSRVSWMMPGLGHAVDEVPAAERRAAGDRADADDAPARAARDHAPAGLAGHQEGPVQVDADHLPPVLERQRLRPGPVADADVVDQDVHARRTPGPAAAIMARTSSGWPRSARAAAARRPSASTSRAVSAAPALSTSLTSTSAPACASARATACPMPPLAPPPVTRATRPSRPNHSEQLRPAHRHAPPCPLSSDPGGPSASGRPSAAAARPEGGGDRPARAGEPAAAALTGRSRARAARRAA